jgi:UDP-N-acetylmuramoyl-tripeptide--D-alanyl-D-alanine ligase
MRNKIAQILRWQAKRYLNKNAPKVVVVTGSVGKTSTTQAIATILSQSFTVRATLANYNTDIGVSCSIFARSIPESLKNPFTWIWLFMKNEVSLISKAPFELLVLELGTDAPGDIAEYSWLKPDIAVVTAVAPEHMEFFKTIDAVASEELSVASYSEKIIVNKNMIDASFLNLVSNDQLFNYSRDDIAHLDISKKDLQVTGDHSIDAIAAGLAVGKALNMQRSELVKGAKTVQSPKGRMRIFSGIKNTTLIDDTYNSSPEAVKAALDYLYSVETAQRIALLGNMNELGDASEQAHEEIGEYCDPGKLDLIITLGPDANKYTLDAAQKQGCTVIESNTPYEAAEIIKGRLKEGATVLFKGSQNGVFAEEAVKLLLINPLDESQLVRQNNFWLKKKETNFNQL